MKKKQVITGLPSPLSLHSCSSPQYPFRQQQRPGTQFRTRLRLLCHRNREPMSKPCPCNVSTQKIELQPIRIFLPNAQQGTCIWSSQGLHPIVKNAEIGNIEQPCGISQFSRRMPASIHPFELTGQRMTSPHLANLMCHLAV